MERRRQRGDRRSWGERFVVSACLVGAHSRFDGTAAAHPTVVRLVREGRALPVCPEQLGGLPTPRPRAEIKGGDGEAAIQGKARVLAEQGEDLTDRFIRGAQEAAELAALFGATKAILKSRSPSCGSGAVYDGSFTGRLVKGDGVLAALLRKKGIDVATEEGLSID